MNNHSFATLEDWFHRLSELSELQRDEALNSLAETDPQLADRLRTMTSSLSSDEEFLDADTLHPGHGYTLEIPLDGSVILAGRYTLIEQIGSGGSGSVFRARSSNPARDVAVKMLRFGLSSLGARARFVEESGALAALSHPHIAHVYETGVHQLGSTDVSIPWIAMELVEGMTSISEYLKTHHPNEQTRIELFTQICKAIHAAHQMGVLHLDLNSSNILVDRYGFPKIIDFGLTGLVVAENSAKIGFIGTRTSLAPEQAKPGSGAIGVKTDIYSLGLLFIEIMTGTQIQSFEGHNNEHIRQQILRGASVELSELVEGIPDTNRPMIRSMLSVSQTQRPASMTQVLDMLAGSPPKTSKRISATILSAIILLLITVGWIFGIQQEAEDTLSLPPEVAFEISSENPRKQPYSSTHARIIDGISTALESSQSMEPTQVADLHAALADNYRIAGQYDQAIAQFKKAIELREIHSSTETFNRTVLDLIDLMLFLGLTENAEQQRLRITTTASATPLFLIDLGIAETKLYLADQRYSEAEKQLDYTKSILPSFPKDYITERIDRMVILADLYDQSNQHTKGLNVLYKARALAAGSFSQRSAPVAMVDVSLAAMIANPSDPASFTEPIELTQNAIQVFQETGDQFHAIWAQRQLGHFYFVMQQYSKAGHAYTLANEQMRDLLGEDHHEAVICAAYQTIAEIAVTQHHDSLIAEFELLLTRLAGLIGQHHAAVVSLREAFEKI